MSTKPSWKLIEDVANEKSEKRDIEYQKIIDEVVKDMKKYSGTLELHRS